MPSNRVGFFAGKPAKKPPRSNRREPTPVDCWATTPLLRACDAQRNRTQAPRQPRDPCRPARAPSAEKRNKSGWQTRELLNQYFDTPERELSAARVALRLRRDGEAIIQTLKCRGTSVAGLSERNEHEWQLDKVKLDLKKLDDSCWPAQLANLDKRPSSRCSPLTSAVNTPKSPGAVARARW